MARTEPWYPDERQLAIYRDYCRGTKTQWEIAQEYGLNQSTVSRLVRRIAGWMAARYIDEIREMKAMHAQRLYDVARRAMLAFERSEQNAVIVTETTEDGQTKTSRTVKGQAGDPRFLAECRAALADIRKIWGADETPPAPVDDGQPRVAGKNRTEAIRQHARGLLEMVEPKDN